MRQSVRNRPKIKRRRRQGRRKVTLEIESGFARFQRLAEHRFVKENNYLGQYAFSKRKTQCYICKLYYIYIYSIIYCIVLVVLFLSQLTFYFGANVSLIVAFIQGILCFVIAPNCFTIILQRQQLNVPSLRFFLNILPSQ